MARGPTGTLATAARELETATQQLVTGAPPPADEVTAARTLADQVSADCAEAAGGETAALAGACAACLRGLEAGDIAVGPVLMYLAASAAMLAEALAGRAPAPRALAASRHELESFTPSDEARRAAAAPDVPVGTLLSRGPRSRT